MKTINSKIENVKEDSKIKKTFKKLKNAFVVGTAALMITCGGTETSDNEGKVHKKLPTEIENVADSFELTTYAYGPNTLETESDPKIRAMDPKFKAICEEDHDVVNTLVPRYDENVVLIDGITTPTEINFGNYEAIKYVDNLGNGISYNKKYYRFEHRGTVAKGYIGFIDIDDFEGHLTSYYVNMITGFNYLGPNPNLVTDETPYLLLCYARYNDDMIFANFKVIPSTILIQMIEEVGGSKEKFYEKAKSLMNCSIDDWLGC